MKIRTDLLHLIVKEKNIKRYLEIGIQQGINFDSIEVPYKVGVEPFPRREQENVLRMTSDEFFKLNATEYDVFDLIFIDGLHTYEQTKKDLYNSLNRLNSNGIIVMHDALPHNIEYTTMDWCGTSYKAVMEAAQDPNLVVKTWDQDHGCAIITIAPNNNVDLVANEITTDFIDLWKDDAKLVNKSNTDEIIEYIKSL